MARGYNIRSRYGQNEQTGPEKFSNALVTGLDAIVAEKEARRSEENEFRRTGGVQVGKAPSAGDRFNAVRRGVGRVFGRGGPPSMVVDETDPALPPPSMMQMRPQAEVSLGNTTMRMPTQAQRPTIASALHQDVDPDLSYEVKGRNGATWKFDPMREVRAKQGMADRSAQAAHARTMEQTKLENAGRKEVATIAANQRTETARYTYGERRQIADRANASKERAAQILASGRAVTANERNELQQALLDLREAALAMQQAGLEASGYENAARAIESKIPTGTDRIVETSQPGGKERIESEEAKAARLRQEAINARRRGAAGGTGTKTPTAAQLARAKREPDYRQFLIEKGYKVP